MLLELQKLISFYGLEPRGVLHLGGHHGEEAAIYAACGIGRVVWVEGNPEMLPELASAVEPYGHLVLQGLLSETAGVPTDFYVTNNGESSSVLPLGTHSVSHPDVVVTHTLALVTTTVDELAAQNDLAGLNLLNIDLQGAELLALRGAVGTLAQFDYVYTEVNRDQVYEGAAQIEELDGFLGERGFTRLVTRWTSAQWGDALYSRAPVGTARRLLGLVRFRQPLARVKVRARWAIGGIWRRARRLVGGGRA
jgi:FkbM family methyltransferase